MSSINGEQDLKSQYKDSSNLSARASIYGFATSGPSWPTWVFDQVLGEIPGEAEVLEIGCGPGALWKTNLPRVPQGWRIILSDLMPGMIAEARARLGGDERFSFMQMNAQRLALPDRSVDAVIANHMLYHVADLPAAVREIRRVLRPGGKLLAGTNSEQHLRRMKQLIGQYMGEASPFAGEMPFSLENGEGILRGGFEHVTKRTLRGELRVTEVEAVVQYVLSVEGAKQVIDGARLDELRRQVTDELASDGVFVTATEVGVFIAR
ncbi:MAG TPA: class I SAM-dependent methyltransferase [Tepidisphaeraceae bacterium]|jgi:ubiquinone/menaquinone biosynthesis C-methylase UbiE